MFFLCFSIFFYCSSTFSTTFPIVSQVFWPWPWCGTNRRLPGCQAHRRVASHRRQLRGRVGVGDRAAEGTLVADLWVCDERHRHVEQGRTLEYYDLKSGDMLQYRKKLRPLRVRTLDGSVKTLLVDDSQTVAELIKAVCARIGTTLSKENHLP